MKQKSIDATFRVRDSTRRQADSAATTGPFRGTRGAKFRAARQISTTKFHQRRAGRARVRGERAVSVWVGCVCEVHQCLRGAGAGGAGGGGGGGGTGAPGSGCACSGLTKRRREPSDGGRRRTSRIRRWSRRLSRTLTSGVLAESSGSLVKVRVSVPQRRPAVADVRGRKNAGGGASRVKISNSVLKSRARPRAMSLGSRSSASGPGEAWASHRVV